MITIQSVIRTLNGSGLHDRHTALDGHFVLSGIAFSFTVISSLSCSANHLSSCPSCSLSRSFSFTQSFQSLSVLSYLVLSFFSSLHFPCSYPVLSYLFTVAFSRLLSLTLPLSFCLPPISLPLPYSTHLSLLSHDRAFKCDLS